MYVRLSGYKTRTVHKYACKSALFRSQARGTGAGAAVRDRIYGFPVELGAASWIMLAVEEEKLRAATRLIGISLSPVESSPALVNIDFVLPTKYHVF